MGDMPGIGIPEERSHEPVNRDGKLERPLLKFRWSHARDTAESDPGAGIDLTIHRSNDLFGILGFLCG
jgi:hypothetical protein